MRKITGFFYKLSYKLVHHCLVQISLKNLLWVLIVFPPMLAFLRRLMWWYAIPISLGGVFFLVCVGIAERNKYLLFEPALFSPSEPSGKPVGVDEQIQGWASGCFAVGGNRRQMLHERAQYSSVSTREHIVMARIERTHFLWFAKSRREQVGWWYAFFKPEHILQVETGYISDGLRMRPGLALTFYSKEAAQEETIYLSFEDMTTLWRVIDDMRTDAAVRVIHR
jgi:hypothetical protein